MNTSRVDNLIARPREKSLLPGRASRRDALEKLVAAAQEYTRAHSDYLDIAFRELHLLRSDLRRTVQARRKEYVAEWARVLRMIRPELDPAEANILCNLALMALADLAQTPQLLRHRGSSADIKNITLNVLLKATSGPGR